MGKTIKYGKLSLLFLIVFINIFICFSISVSDEVIDQKVDRWGYKYSSVVHKGERGSKYYIETQNPTDNSKFGSRYYSVMPNDCRPEITIQINKIISEKLNKGNICSGPEYIAFCRHDSGNEPTLYIFSAGILRTKLMFDVNEANLQWDDELYAFIARANYRFECRPDSGRLAKGFLVVYLWNPKYSLFEQFHPVFDKRTEKYYLEHYSSLKKECVDDPGCRGEVVRNLLFPPGDLIFSPLISTLSAISSQETICSELSSFPLNTLNNDELNEYIKVAKSNGYPAINLSRCKGEK